MNSRRIITAVVIVALGLLMSGFQTEPVTNVQGINTFLNFGQFGLLMYLLYRSDNALMRQRKEQADERGALLLMLERAWGRNKDEKQAS